MAVLDFSGKMLERDANKDRRAGLRGTRDLFSTSKLYNQLGAYGMAGLGFLANVNPITAAIMAAGGGYLGSKYAESKHEQPVTKFHQGEIQSELDRAEESKYANTLQNAVSVGMAAHGMKEMEYGFTGDFSASPISKVMGDIGIQAKTLGQNIGTTARNISDRAYMLRHGISPTGELTAGGMKRMGITQADLAPGGLFHNTHLGAATPQLTTRELLKSHAGDMLSTQRLRNQGMSATLGYSNLELLGEHVPIPKFLHGTWADAHPLLFAGGTLGMGGLLGYGMYQGLRNKGEE